MATLREVSDAIVAGLENLGGSGLDAAGYPDEGRTAPYVDLVLSDANRETMTDQGVWAFRFELRLFVAKTARPQDGYWLLLEFLDNTGPKSIDQAIWNVTLPGQASIFVREHRLLGPEEVDGVDNYGAAFTIEVSKGA